MSLSVKGKLSRKLSVESGTSQAGKEWKKQPFLIDTGAQYNPEICFQLFGEDKIEILNHHNEGDQVEVSFTYLPENITENTSITLTHGELKVKELEARKWKLHQYLMLRKQKKTICHFKNVNCKKV